MSLEAFKGIFWLEYWHRVAGRVVGLLFLLPLVYFAIRYSLPRWLSWRLASIFLLGGLQGILGWYMVKSGLVDQPMVSPYRLAAHLGMAFLILGLLVWTICQVNRPRDKKTSGAVSWLPALFCGIIFTQTLLGALVAGLDAGLTYNSFPLMDGRWIPAGLYVMEPWYINHFENVTMVQFQHRLGAYVLAGFMVLLAMQARKKAELNHLWPHILLLFAIFTVQFALGVLTLLHHVPTVLASSHQAVAAIFFALSVWLWYDSRVTEGWPRRKVLPGQDSVSAKNTEDLAGMTGEQGKQLG